MPKGGASVTFPDILAPNGVIADLDAADVPTAISALVGRMVDTDQLQAESAGVAVRSVMALERTRGTSGIGAGMALPHAKLASHDRVCLVIGRSRSGIDFAALDREPVHGVFLVLSPAAPQAAEQHLAALDLVFGLMRLGEFRRTLMQAVDADAIYDAVFRYGSGLAVESGVSTADSGRRS